MASIVLAATLSCPTVPDKGLQALNRGAIQMMRASDDGRYPGILTHSLSLNGRNGGQDEPGHTSHRGPHPSPSPLLAAAQPPGSRRAPAVPATIPPLRHGGAPDSPEQRHDGGTGLDAGDSVRRDPDPANSPLSPRQASSPGTRKSRLSTDRRHGGSDDAPPSPDSSWPTSPHVGTLLPTLQPPPRRAVPQGAEGSHSGGGGSQDSTAMSPARLRSNSSCVAPLGLLGGAAVGGGVGPLPNISPQRSQSVLYSKFPRRPSIELTHEAAAAAQGADLQWLRTSPGSPRRRPHTLNGTDDGASNPFVSPLHMREELPPLLARTTFSPSRPLSRLLDGPATPGGSLGGHLGSGDAPSSPTPSNAAQHLFSSGSLSLRRTALPSFSGIAVDHMLLERVGMSTDRGGTANSESEGGSLGHPTLASLFGSPSGSLIRRSVNGSANMSLSPMQRGSQRGASPPTLRRGHMDLPANSAATIAAGAHHAVARDLA